MPTRIMNLLKIEESEIFSGKENNSSLNDDSLNILKLKSIVDIKIYLLIITTIQI